MSEVVGRYLSGWRRIGAGAAGFLLVHATAAGAASPPRFVERPCGFPEGVEPAARCGVLEVPEVRGADGGRLLEIRVAVLPADTPDPAPDPVVFLTGGPGQAALTDVSSWAGHPLRRSRDLVLVDQRGTGQSALCPDLLGETLAILAADLDPATDVAAHVAAAGRCRAALAARGVDPANWGSGPTADDMEDLRRALGLPAWNLAGVSYGTRLALTALERHPEGVRSLLLDGPYPPGVDLREGLALEPPLARLDAACAASPGCAEVAFPRGDLGAAADAVARTPASVEVEDVPGVPGGVFTVNPQDVRFLFGYLAPFSIARPVLPALLSEWRQGRLRSMGPLWGLPAAGLDLGKYYAVLCAENAWDPRVGLAEGGTGQAFVDALGPACAAWGAEPTVAVPGVLPKAGVPVLVLSGEEDLRSPAAWAEGLAASLPRATLVRVPGAGHGTVGPGCVGDLATAFLADPDHAPDSGCLAAVEPPSLLGAVLPTPGPRRLLRGVPAGEPLPLAWAGTGLALILAALATPVRGALVALRRRRGVSTEPGLVRALLWLGGAALCLGAFHVGVTLALVDLLASPHVLALVAGIPARHAPLLLLPAAGGVCLLLGGAAALRGGAWRGWSPGDRAAAVLVAACAMGALGLGRLLELF